MFNTPKKGSNGGIGEQKRHNYIKRTNGKMADVNYTLSEITLNLSELNRTMKRQRLT